ncbi:MAG: YraN family protein [Bacteroidaceae bacterium]|nr:YraN family protein [Bacteroidaceae bacterium]MBQ6938441.1 YraN family protein [Muribaculaceae bacterium]MBR4069739.1 YraN family protein [Bacteroidaceae bacterium]
MAQHNLLGKSGEEYAAEYLISRGYVVRDINWVSGKYELDIVAYRDATIIVVEVKTRSNVDFAYPEEAVTEKKIRNTVRATDAYMRMFELDMEVRFDVISIVGKEPPFEIEHIEDAFVAPLNI